MFSFTIGNLITILIVVVILAVFRQLDKNNRSLEKVKRYTDKVTSELDGFIDEKTIELKNLAIELDVHQKSGKEILKRISSVEDGLSERAGDIDKINARIGEYDSALSELVGMTGRVDENLKRLHQESEFVDKVGRRIKEAKEHIEELEQRIPSLSQEFAKHNLEELRRVTEQVTVEAQRRVEDIAEEVGRCHGEVNEFSDYLTRLESRRDGLEEETIASIDRAFQGYRDKADVAGEDTVERVSGELDAAVRESEERFRNAETRAQSAVQEIEGILEANRKRLEELSADFSDRTAAAGSGLDERLREIEERAKDLDDELFGELKDYIESKAEKVRDELSIRLQGDRDTLEAARAGIADTIAALASATDGKIDEINAEAEKQSRLRREELEASLEKQMKLIADFEDTIHTRFASLEEKIGDFEEDLSYRVGGLESLSDGIDSVDKALRGSIEDMSMNLRKEIIDFGAKLEEEFSAAKQTADQRLDILKESIKTLEDEISDLKGKAYQNVSEKLQVFEDEFFQDLSDRNNDMQRRIEEWKEQIGNSMEEISQQFSNERIAYEKKSGDELKDKLSLLQNKTFQQYERFEDQVSGFQERIDERMNLTENTFKNFELSVQKKLEEEKNNALVHFSKEFTEHSTMVSAQLKKDERELEAELKSIHELVETDKKELTGILEAARSDVTVWQAQVLQQMKDVDTDLGERYAKLTTEANEHVAEIHQAFTEQKNGFDSFMLDLQKRSKELQGEIDQRLKEFRLNLQEMREKVEAAQKRLYGKIEENYRTLQVSLQEIDKRQANFINQTKIFDRADSLKVALMENIEDLKIEIERVGALGKEVMEAEKKFLTIKKIGEDVTSKLTRFLTEKRRIEDMEGDFKKLINISQSVDVKLDQVTASHDNLQAIQARIRQLEELEKEVLQKYERLDKKGDILDATVDGIDKSFQKIDDIDRELESIQQSLVRVPDQIGELEKRIETLAHSRKDAEEAIKRAEQLSAILDDLDKRTEKMQKAREWLAGAETRMEAINRQAQEQVKLLGNILKEGKESGKTAMGARDVVIKLAHQGWKAEEIARATKLSRGEVELILELIPKK